MKYEIEKLTGEVKINFTLTEAEWEEYPLRTFPSLPF